MFKPNDYELMKEYCHRQELHCEAVRIGDEMLARKQVLRLPIRIGSLLLIVILFVVLTVQV
jgi:hypothetical protein